MNKISIGKEVAIKLAESKWWEECSSKEIALFQMHIDELSMPFNLFHLHMEEALGRPVFIHEFGLNYEGLLKELKGEIDSPTQEEIFNLIPEHKRIILKT